jgi:hypothetical protein
MIDQPEQTRMKICGFYNATTVKGLYVMTVYVVIKSEQYNGRWASLVVVIVAPRHYTYTNIYKKYN